MKANNVNVAICTGNISGIVSLKVFEVEIEVNIVERFGNYGARMKVTTEDDTLLYKCIVKIVCCLC